MSSGSTSSLQSSSRGSLLNKSITSIKPDEELEENTNENEIDGVKEEEESLEEEAETNENESSETSESEEISVITDESSSIAKFLNIVKNDNTGIISIEIIVIFALVSFVIIKRYNYKIIKKEKNKDKKSIIIRIINKFKNRHKKKKRNKKKV